MVPSGEKKSKNVEALPIEWKSINKCVNLCLNVTGIKYYSLNVFQWGHFCPLGPKLIIFST